MIKPNDSDIEGILTKSDRKYSIPKYQRNFDWGKSELQELVDDLKEVAKNDNESLFLGNFIFDVSDPNDYSIVDGQQRLTTISLISIAIRQHAKRINETSFAGEMQKYITVKATWSKDNSNRIKVAPNIREVFEYISQSEWDGVFPEKIDNRSVKRQVNKIRPIYNHLMEELKTYNIDDLMGFTRALMTSYVVTIDVENTSDVFAIFERTNARGLDLNISDLLKNLILSKGSDQYSDQWGEVISRAEGTVPKMLKYFWVTENGYIKQSDLYKHLKEKAIKTGIDTFMDELHTFSKFYSAVKSADEAQVGEWLADFGLESLAKNEDHLKRIVRTFQALKLFRITQAFPVIFSLFHLFNKDSKANVEKLINTLEAIEKYHFINNIVANRIGNDVEKYYSDKAPTIHNSNSGFDKEARLLIDELRKKKAGKQEFKGAFTESITYDEKNLALLAYFYDRINNFKVKGSQIVKIYTPEKVGTKRDYNIDHILPQKLKETYSVEDQDKFDLAGNLILISRHSNSEFQHKSPADKKALIESDKKHYGNLRYIDDFLKDYSKELDSWSLNSIQARTQDLSEDAYDRIWQF